MTDITIPPEALEAGARVLAEAYHYDADAANRFWEDFTEDARAACLAMLQAWPRMYRTDSTLFSPALILPIPKGLDFIDPLTAQENPDDKA